MDTKEAGRRGGLATTEAKQQASRANLERAREALKAKRQQERLTAAPK